MTEPEWLAWQLADSAFPAGGFAHSWGLEAAWQSGEVPGLAGLAAFVQAVLEQTGRGVLPMLNAAHRARQRLGELDQLTDVFLTNPIANRASRMQGRAFASTCARVWPAAALRTIEGEARDGHGHAAPVMGAALAALEVPRGPAQRLCLYTTARGVLAAAVRLGIAGGYDAQRLQYDLLPQVEAVVRRCGSLDERDLAQTAPVLDLLHGAHDRLYSRLFQS